MVLFQTVYCHLYTGGPRLEKLELKNYSLQFTGELVAKPKVDKYLLWRYVRKAVLFIFTNYTQ